MTLQLLWRFRFGSNAQLARYFGKVNGKLIQKRLKVLEDQGFIAKRYDKTYKLQGKPAAYYILPGGARTLAKLTNRKKTEPINFKQLYRSKDASEDFITHCLNIFSIYLELRATYLDKLNYFTRNQLNYPKWDYFPQPLQDAFVRVKTKDGWKDYFMDIYEDKEPFFVLVRRIKKYLEYLESGDWGTTDSDFPTILMVCENKSMHKRLRKRIAYELRQSYEEVSFATTMLTTLLTNSQQKGKVWMPIDQEGDDPDEPTRPKSLRVLTD
jgi:hypothetical protein